MTNLYPFVRPGAEADVATKSGERAAMEDDLQLIGDIRDGVVAMRRRCAVYLPQYSKEGTDEYKRRIAMAPWRPEFEDALRTLSAKPFSKAVSFPDGTPVAIKNWAADVDGKGNDIHVFAKQIFTESLACGVAGILISYPSATFKTRADELQANPKPYWVHVNVANVIAVFTEIRNGVEVIVHARIRECYTERDGWGEKKIERVVVYEPGRWTRWQKNETTNKYETIEEGEVTVAGRALDAVPLVLFYSGKRIGMLQVKPALRDLADMQVELFRAMSRQNEILEFSGSPMLSGTGIAPPKDGSTISVGPKVVLFAPATGDGKSGAWSYVQPDVANLVAIGAHVESVIRDLRHLAMQPDVARSGDVTATASSVNAAKAHSALESWAIRLRDALERAFQFTAPFLNVKEQISVNVHSDFGVGDQNNADAKTLLDAQKAEVISKKTVRDELVRRGFLGPNFDSENEDEQIAAEVLGLEPEAQINPRSGATVQLVRG
jgi:Domain of unknown function (DUF4055)